MPYPGMQVTERYKSRLSGYANVLSTSISSSVPGRPFGGSFFRARGDDTYQGHLLMIKIVVDREFISTYGLELVEGRDFSKDMMNDGEGELILNEAAMRHFGWTSCAGKEVENIWPQGGEVKVEYRGEVVGVVKDFHYQSLHHQIEPLIITTVEKWFEYFAIRIRSDDVAGTLGF